jgi:hypothetical protein
VDWGWQQGLLWDFCEQSRREVLKYYQTGITALLSHHSIAGSTCGHFVKDITKKHFYNPKQSFTNIRLFFPILTVIGANKIF